MEGVPSPPSTLYTKKSVEVDYCKSWSLCVGDHIILMAENPFLPFPRSVQVFFTISIFSKATINKEKLRGSP